MIINIQPGGTSAGDFTTDSMIMNAAYILIPALPFAAFLIIALGSRWLGETSHRLAIPAVFASFILSVLACIDVYQNGARSIPLYTPIKSGSLTVEAGLYIDAVTVLLLFLVTGVSSLVHVFSSRYMQADPRYARFFSLIALFTSAMVMLVMGANLFMLFMFWEIMGLCSYLLISHWSRRPSACDAATKKDELLEEEFVKFVSDTKPEEAEAIPAIKTFFKAYVTSDQVRYIIQSKHFTDLATNPVFSTRDFRAVPEKYRRIIPEYVKDYVSLNQFTA